MYTDEDLTGAVDKGIFSKQAVSDFRAYIDSLRENKAVDEEQFRLVSGFNDIFVVILGVVLMSSVDWLATYFGIWGTLASPATAWMLAEVYVRRRRMALPAILFLLAFTLGIYSSFIEITSAILGEELNDLYYWHENSYVVYAAALMAAVATWVHWLRFKVPITVAAGAGLLVVVVVTFFSGSDTAIRSAMFACGVLVLALAMYWDMSDLKRVTRRSDIAFWLHLLAAPLLVHPVFTMLNVFDDPNTASIITVLALYVMLSIISLLINRRSLMVSALFYVIYAVHSFMLYDPATDEFYNNLAITGLLISLPLLVLSAKWHASRDLVLACFPWAKRYMPSTGT